MHPDPQRTPITRDHHSTSHPFHLFLPQTEALPTPTRVHEPPLLPVLPPFLVLHPVHPHFLRDEPPALVFSFLTSELLVIGKAGLWGLESFPRGLHIEEGCATWRGSKEDGEKEREGRVRETRIEALVEEEMQVRKKTDPAFTYPLPYLALLNA